MDWDHYHRLRLTLEQKHYDDVLAEIETAFPDGTLSSPYACLKAKAFMGLKRPDAASAALQKLVDRDDDDYWCWHTLAETYRQQERWTNVFTAIQSSHKKMDWPQSQANGYRFTHDYFSPNIPNWRVWFDKHITKTGLKALEIGSWQGGSACWLLDNIIGPRSGHITCIDAFLGSSEHQNFLQKTMSDIDGSLENLFDDNTARTGWGDKAHLKKCVGFSQNVLPGLQGQTFDFIYIDGAHEAKYVIQDAVLCWNLLSPGGFMLFDDMPCAYADSPNQNTARAVEFFISVFEDELDVIESGYQLLLQRKTE